MNDDEISTDNNVEVWQWISHCKLIKVEDENNEYVNNTLNSYVEGQ